MSLRRRIMMIGDESMGLRYKTGETVAEEAMAITIEHGLDEVPFLFALVGDYEETDSTLAGVFLNYGKSTRYTSTVAKDWVDYGVVYSSVLEPPVAMTLPTANAYGTLSVDEKQITIQRYAKDRNFTVGKTYKWIAIADWRS